MKRGCFRIVKWIGIAFGALIVLSVIAQIVSPQEEEASGVVQLAESDQSEPTFTPTSVDTATPVPPDTATPMPTNTGIPPTDTPLPAPTDTPSPVPTNTPSPTATNTPLPSPTSTPMPIPTDAPVVDSSTPWYVGGTLHQATVSEWVDATYENKMATAADWAVAAMEPKDMVETFAMAVYLTTCVDESAIGMMEIAPQSDVTELAVLCAMMFDPAVLEELP